MTEVQPIEYAVPQERQAPTVAEVCRAWEKLRLVFIGVLAVPTVLIFVLVVLQSPDPRSPWFYLIQAAVGAVIANVCYLAGPAAEFYAIWAGVKNTLPLRIVLFVLGTGTCLLFGSASLFFSAIRF